MVSFLLPPFSFRDSSLLMVEVNESWSLANMSQVHRIHMGEKSAGWLRSTALLGLIFPWNAGVFFWGVGCKFLDTHDEWFPDFFHNLVFETTKSRQNKLLCQNFGVFFYSETHQGCHAILFGTRFDSWLWSFLFISGKEEKLPPP